MLAIVMFFNIESIFRKILHKATTIFLVFPLSLSLSLSLSNTMSSSSLQSFETRHGGPPGQSLGNGFCPGHRINPIFFYKSKQNRFDKKNKKIINELYPDFLPGFFRSTG